MSSVCMAMLEITGRCARNCPTCLPRSLKTQHTMTLGEIEHVAKEFSYVGIRNVTIAGFGDPANHPDIDVVLRLLGSRYKMVVAIVCRPSDMEIVKWADRVVVSVQTIKDAERVVECSKRTDFSCINVHTVLDVAASREVDGIIDVISPNISLEPGNISRMSFGCSVKLCDSLDHTLAVRKANAGTVRRWNKLFRNPVVATRPDWIFMTPPGPYADRCPFLNNMIYVDSNGFIRPCCHNPVGKSFVNIFSTDLKVALVCGWGLYRDSIKGSLCKNCQDLACK